MQQETWVKQIQVTKVNNNKTGVGRGVERTSWQWAFASCIETPL